MRAEPQLAVVDALSARLHDLAYAQGGDMLWLAVDAPAPSAVALPQELQAALDAPTAHTVPIRHPELDPAVLPRWLLLNTADATGSQLLRQSIEHAVAEAHPDALRSGAGRRIAGWFTLEGDLADAAGHCGAQMLRRRPDGRRSLLRLHDPAVLWALWPLLSPAQQRRLLGPIDAWWLLDPCGNLTPLQRPPAAAVPTPGEDSVWSAELWNDIDHIGPLNAALRERAPADPAALEQAHRAAMHAMRRASRAGYNDAHDLAAYAAHAIGVHPDFDRHPTLQRALASAQPGDRYTALVGSWSAQDWRDVQQALG